MKPTKLSELIEALEFDSEERVTRVDLQNGCVVSVDQSLLSALEEGDAEALPDLPDWEKPELEIARAPPSTAERQKQRCRRVAMKPNRDCESSNSRMPC